jgi:hypothetical protein
MASYLTLEDDTSTFEEEIQQGLPYNFIPILLLVVCSKACNNHSILAFVLTNQATSHPNCLKNLKSLLTVEYSTISMNFAAELPFIHQIPIPFHIPQRRGICNCYSPIKPCTSIYSVELLLTINMLEKVIKLLDKYHWLNTGLYSEWMLYLSSSRLPHLFHVSPSLKE